MIQITANRKLKKLNLIKIIIDNNIKNINRIHMYEGISI